MRKKEIITKSEIVDKQIKKVFPIFFWHKCNKCGEYVKFEWMYKETFYHAYYNEDEYGCMTCFNNKKEFFDYNRDIPPKPSIPPWAVSKPLSNEDGEK